MVRQVGLVIKDPYIVNLVMQYHSYFCSMAISAPTASDNVTVEAPSEREQNGAMDTIPSTVSVQDLIDVRGSKEGKGLKRKGNIEEGDADGSGRPRYCY